MDKRILNTKNKLTNTLLELLKTKKIKDITVLELCKKANINRTTFYKYYKDVDDLVLKIEESLISDLEKYISDIKRNYLISYTSKIIETINDHRDIYSRLLSENGDHTFLRKISSISSPLTGQLKTVHIFWSSSPRWAMSAPDWMLTRVVPPTFTNFQS